jgi:F420-dependent oxidoreductase-like protein
VNDDRRRFSLGFSLGISGGLTPSAMLELARVAERLGYDCAWSAEMGGSDPYPLLGWIAGQTTSIGVGTCVLQISGRTPVATATGAATLDRISGGRFRLGLGASGPQVVEGFYGQPYARPLARTRDYVAVVRMALAGQPLSYRGATLQLPLPDGEAAARPVLTPPPGAGARQIPIYLAAVGPRSIALAAEIGDAWMAIHSPPGYLAQARTWLAQGASRSGRDPGEIGVAVLVCVHVDRDIDTAREMVRPALAMYVGSMGTRQTNFYHGLATRLGFGAQADLVRQGFGDDKIGDAIMAVSDEMVDAMTVCGPPDLVRRRLAEYRDAGATSLIAGLTTPSARMRREQLEILAEIGQAIGSVPAR